MSASGHEAEQTPAPPEGEASTETTETTAAPPSEGLDRLYARMDEMTQQQRALIESLSAPAETEDEEDESAYYTDDGQLTEDGARAVIADMVREQVESQMAPREAQALVDQRDDAYEALKSEYPDLADEKIAQPILDRAIRWAQSANPAVIDRPEFVDVIEAFYKAEKYEELRQAQEAEQPRPVVLESAQGAARQQRSQEVDWQKRVIDAASKDSPRI